MTVTMITSNSNHKKPNSNTLHNARTHTHTRMYAHPPSHTPTHTTTVSWNNLRTSWRGREFASSSISSFCFCFERSSAWLKWHWEVKQKAHWPWWWVQRWRTRWSDCWGSCWCQSRWSSQSGRSLLGSWTQSQPWTGWRLPPGWSSPSAPRLCDLWLQLTK